MLPSAVSVAYNSSARGCIYYTFQLNNIKTEIAHSNHYFQDLRIQQLHFVLQFFYRVKILTEINLILTEINLNMYITQVEGINYLSFSYIKASLICFITRFSCLLCSVKTFRLSEIAGTLVLRFLYPPNPSYHIQEIATTQHHPKWLNGLNYVQDIDFGSIFTT